MQTLTYEEAVRYLCIGGDEGEDRKEEARQIVTDTVWELVSEEGDGKNELFDWIAEGSWVLSDISGNAAQSVASEWDEYQRQARAAM